MFILGITGGIGTGKTTVTGILQKAGAWIIDADELSRKVTAKGMPAIAEISDQIGKQFVVNHELNRKALSSYVFSKPDKKMIVEQIIHKYVVQSIDETISMLTKNGYEGIVVLDVPIPVQRGFIDACNEIWVVESPMNIRLKRIMDRNGWTSEEILARMNSQMTEEEYRGLADHVLVNDRDYQHLTSQICQLLMLKEEDAFKAMVNKLREY